MYYELGVIFLLALGVIWIIRLKADDWGLIDIPNERSTHQTFTPRGAGIAFYLSVMLVTPFFHLDLMIHYLWTTLAVFLVFIVGLLDDHHDTAPKTKFIVLLISTILLSFDGLVIDDIGVFFGMHLAFGWFAVPFTIFAVTGFTNALNFIDGLDGLAASISLIILVSFFTIGYMHEDMFIMTLSSVFVMTLCAFLFYNWYPASIFMGDSGSLTLGFVISILAVKSLAYIPTVSILFIAAVPILDALIVMIRRRRNGYSMFEADDYHMHHILRRLFKDNTVLTVLSLVSLQICYSLIALQFDRQIDEGILFILFIVNVMFFYVILEYMKEKQEREIS